MGVEWSSHALELTEGFPSEKKSTAQTEQCTLSTKQASRRLVQKGRTNRFS